MVTVSGWEGRSKVSISSIFGVFPSKIEWDLTNRPLSKLLELLDTQIYIGVRSEGPIGDFLDFLGVFFFRNKPTLKLPVED